jgi:2-hydroxychromene-2-carboxylate isomerase
MSLEIESVDPGLERAHTEFYFDIGDPECWLAAERVITTLGAPAPWVPVLAADLGTHPPGEGSAETWLAVAAIASERGLLEFRPPSRPQLDSRDVMLAATFARQCGKVVAYTLAAMRQCWCAGRDLADHDTIALAGAAAEVHPNALATAIGMRSVASQLDAATAAAGAAGVERVPAVRVGEEVFHGDESLEAAALRLQS